MTDTTVPASRDWRMWFGLAVVAAAGLLAAGVDAVVAEGIERTEAYAIRFAEIDWREPSAVRSGAFALWLVPCFCGFWFLTNYYIHRRTGARLSRLLLRDAPVMLLMAPLVGVLLAFGPAGPRMRALSAVRWWFLVALVWKLRSFVKTVLADSASVRRRDVFAMLLVVSVGLFVVDHPRPLTGDEPHYLVITHSLLHDGDLDLTDDYTPDVYGSFFRGRLAGHTVSVADGSGGQLHRPSHHPGLPALFLPGYGVAGVYGAKAVMLLMLCVALTGMFSLLVRLGVGAAISAGAVVLLAGASPFVTYGVNLYPEMFAAAALVWAVGLLVGRNFALREALGVALLASALPWLQIRFAPLSAVLGVWVLVRARGRIKECLALIVPAMVSGGLLLLFYRGMYGGFDPSIDTRLPEGYSYIGALSLRRFTGYFFAVFLDSHGGVFVYAPVLVLAPLGIILLWRRNRRACMILSSMVLAGVSVIAIGWRPWHGGWSPPSRLLMCICPLLGVAAVVAYEYCLKSRWQAWVCHVLLAVGTILGLFMVMEPESMYSRHGPGTLPGITASYFLIRPRVFFPHYADGGAKVAVLTLCWLAAISVFTWAALGLRSRTRGESAGLNVAGGTGD